MLVSIVLLSMVAVGMASVMRSMAQAQDRVEHRLDQSDEIRVATDFVESVLGRVSTRRAPRLLKEGESPYLFLARPQELIWVGVLPPRFGMGGRHYFRLALEAGQSGPALTLRFLPWDGAAAMPNWESAQMYEIANAITTFSLSYEDTWQPMPQWVNAWQRVDNVPARIRIDLATESGPWPLWIVAMRPLPASQPGTSRFTTGGS